mmetsp:Transcript_27284/g.69398  ORF Transcript_27284/g.69398 Transcript_27284/m.69398 type:complete len:245 (-) Transcript_27284:725-1459(-)
MPQRAYVHASSGYHKLAGAARGPPQCHTGTRRQTFTTARAPRHTWHAPGHPVRCSATLPPPLDDGAHWRFAMVMTSTKPPIPLVEKQPLAKAARLTMPASTEPPWSPGIDSSILRATSSTMSSIVSMAASLMVPFFFFSFVICSMTFSNLSFTFSSSRVIMPSSRTSRYASTERRLFWRRSPEPRLMSALVTTLWHSRTSLTVTPRSPTFILLSLSSCASAFFWGTSAAKAMMSGHVSTFDSSR